MLKCFLCSGECAVRCYFCGRYLCNSCILFFERYGRSFGFCQQITISGLVDALEITLLKNGSLEVEI